VELETGQLPPSVRRSFRSTPAVQVLAAVTFALAHSRIAAGLSIGIINALCLSRSLGHFVLCRAIKVGTSRH